MNRLKHIDKAMNSLLLCLRGVSRVVKACFNFSTKISNVEPVAYEDE